MFQSLFKRSAKLKSPAKAEPVKSDPAADQRAASQMAREAALGRADALAHDEAALADFILQCEYADARLKAAQHVHSKPALEKLAPAMRKSDRRVAKLLQQRLDQLLQQEAGEEKAARCVAQAQRLLQEPQLMVNQVADLDRAWQQVGAVSAAAAVLFEDHREKLRQRLEAQTALQRSVIDVVASLEQAMKSAVESPALHAPGDIARILDELEQKMAQHRAAPEAASLPRHLLSDFDRRQRDFRQSLAALEQRHAAIAAHEEAFAGWEAGLPADMKEDALLRAWRALPALHGDDAPRFKLRLDLLVGRIRAANKPKEAVRASARETGTDPAGRDTGDTGNPGNIMRQFSDALAAIESALENGALQSAAEHDRILRALDLKAIRLSDAQTARMAKARAELGKLQGWAKWGGNVSREELLKAAEELPAQGLAVRDLANKVGSLRERWKSLDVSAGPAGKDLWNRFDTACTTAYAPAAEHFKKLAEERLENVAKGQALVAQVSEFAGATNAAMEAGADDVDWKAVAGFCTRMTQSWQRLGPIDRKDRKKLDAEFGAAMRRLTDPLAVRQQAEAIRREQLIEEVVSLNPADRRALDLLQAAQERWQEQARSLPLPRNEEQALWSRFRSACDAVFAKRRDSAKEADAERRHHLEAKEALCAALEAAATAEPEEIRMLLRDTREAWVAIGPVPHAAERQIDARHQAAVEALQKRLDQAQRAVSAAQSEALRAKLALCHRVERQLAERRELAATEADRLQNDWQALPALAPEFERTLRSRLDAAITASQSDAAGYIALLERNKAALMQEVLRLEILTGQSSPPELAHERLRLQVEVLKSSLTTGQKPAARETQLLQLCGLRALTDGQTAGRIDQLLFFCRAGS